MGKERLDEIENPELAMGRMQELYEKKGYPKDWIDKRLRGIAVRQDLTGEWKARGVACSLEFAILTHEIMQGTFALKVDDYKQVKPLDRDNLRDQMTDIKLILTMLGEAKPSPLSTPTPPPTWTAKRWVKNWRVLVTSVSRSPVTTRSAHFLRPTSNRAWCWKTTT